MRMIILIWTLIFIKYIHWPSELFFVSFIYFCIYPDHGPLEAFYHGQAKIFLLVSRLDRSCFVNSTWFLFGFFHAHWPRELLIIAKNKSL